MTPTLRLSNVQPQFLQRVAAAVAGLRAGEPREELLAEHGRIVIAAAEAELRLG